MPEPQDTYDNLRSDIGVAFDSLDDTAAAKIIARANNEYPGNPAKALAHARVIALRNLRAQAATMTKYQQNETVEDPTTIFGNYDTMIDEWVAERDKLPDQVATAGQFPSLFGVARGGRGR